jgi:benzodiazapine receptor
MHDNLINTFPLIIMLKKYNLEPYLIGIVICLGLGMLSGLITQGQFTWYHNLNQPSFTPPDWLFGPVWSVLYIFMGIILGHLFRQRAKTSLWLIFISQLCLNLAWTPLFFYFHQITLALIDIILLWVCLLIWLLVNRQQRLSVGLFIPYTLWVSFALVLNISFLILNH